jgi:hypothetical protein
VGGSAGYWLGRTPIGVVAALSGGVLLTLGGLGLWYLDAPTSVLECYECNEYWGRWMDETMFTVWLPLTLTLWALGVAVGSSNRRPRLRRNRMPRTRP